MNRNEAARGKRVLLISMPWGTCMEPCLGISILKSVLTSHSIGCDCLYASMRLLRYVKYNTWVSLSQSWAANDFVFTREFEDQASPEQIQVLERLIQDKQDCLALSPKAIAPAEPQILKMLRARNEVIPRFLDDILAEIDFSAYCLVGFSCLFDQTMASLALARRIKRIHPGITVAFGGYALQRPVGPELQNVFAEMDVVSYGDGEPVIVPLFEASTGVRPLGDVPNISYRDPDGKVVDLDHPVKIDLDTSPTPNFDDFFIQREELEEKHGVSFLIGEMPVESSRGCWYGQKAHCVFCGIDDETLRYRVKSSDITVSQLDQLHGRYNVTSFRFSDYIMPMTYYQSFLPEMAARNAPYTLHYETKANLKRSQIDLCAAAGIRYLQPGIESFSSPVLKLMAKGVSAAQNIFTLYTILNNGMYSFYNLIFGFPYESSSDYEDLVRILPYLFHLIPPQTTVPVLVTRYAPLATDPERFGAKQPLKAHWRYDVVFSSHFKRETNLAMESYCYYFDSPYRNFDGDLSLLHKVLQHQVLRWRERFESGKSQLTYRLVADSLLVEDTRLSDSPQVHRLSRAHGFVGDVLRTGLFNRKRLLNELGQRDIDAQHANAAIEDLIQARIVLEIDGSLIWLALPNGYLGKLKQFGLRSNREVRHSREWPAFDTACLTRNGSSPASEEAPFVVLTAKPSHSVASYE